MSSAGSHTHQFEHRDADLFSVRQDVGKGTSLAVPLRMPICLDVLEKRSPTWALVAPGLYLLLCLVAVGSVDRADIGMSAVVLAAGVIPAFAIPAVFTIRRARLAFNDGHL